MTRYRGFQEWLLDEGEQAFRNPLNEARNADDPSMRDAVDKAAADMRWRDEKWQKHRDKWFAEWKRDRPTLTLSEYVDQLCEQIRRSE